MPKLVIATLVKNESQKFWRSALRTWSQFSDRIIVLDDGSTDDTARMAVDAGAVVYYRDGGMWGNEAPARAELFDIAINESEEGDFLFILDADMVPARDPRELCFNGTATDWGFYLYDLWDVNRYRADGYWYGHLHPRVWLIKRPAPRQWEWPEAGIHTGHLPLNYHVGKMGFAPVEYALLHYAYQTPELREAKYKQYMSVRTQLSVPQLAHAKSIMDENPKTFALPFRPQFQLELEPRKLEVA